MKTNWFLFTKIFFVLLLLITMPISICGQISNQVPLPKVIPLTPNAAALGKYGDIPVNLYTGQIGVKIPMYEIIENDIKLPIDLAYNYNGFKIEEYPSWTGMGWSLNITGVINRQIRGLADESVAGYNGYAKNGLQVTNFLSHNMSWDERLSFLDNGLNRRIDTEPDVFIFNFFGHSGKFYFDQTQCNNSIKTPVLIPNQKLKISATFDYDYRDPISGAQIGAIKKITITDTNGNEYVFDVVEQPADLGIDVSFDDASVYTNTWYLSKITTPKGAIIEFKYKHRITDMPSTVSEIKYLYHPFSNNIPIPRLDQTQFTSVSVAEAILEEIRFSSGKIKLIEGDTRSDWDPSRWIYSRKLATEQPRTLAKLQLVNNSNKLIKEFDFSYNQENRLMLTSVQEKNYSEANTSYVDKPPYRFYYEEGYMPRIGNTSEIFSQDHWGYFTGLSSSTLLPSYLLEVRVNGELEFIEYPGNNRCSKHSSAKVGLLKQIKYPTGGITNFEYEPNTFFFMETWIRMLLIYALSPKNMSQLYLLMLHRL